MTDATFVEEAAGWARKLTRGESRGPGDMENAWVRLENRYGVPASVFWALRYRRPKEIKTSLYFRLRAAYEAECARQMRRLQHEIETTEAITGPSHAAVRAASALVGEKNSKAKR